MKNCIVFQKEQMQNHTAEKSLLLNDTFTLWLVLIAIIIITEVFVLCVKIWLLNKIIKLEKNILILSTPFWWFASRWSANYC